MEVWERTAAGKSEQQDREGRAEMGTGVWAGEQCAAGVQEEGWCPWMR